MNFADQLIHRIQTTQNPVCVGLDPRLKNLPEALRDSIDPSCAESIAAGFETFCKEILDVVANRVPVVKPQSAFFEALGFPGSRALANVVNYAKTKKVLVLLDAKRGDIGSTAEAYAQAYIGDAGSHGIQADALTVNPYMGVDTLEPFVKACQANNKGMFVLVKTSNPGSGHFQDKRLTTDKTGSATLHELVAAEVETLSGNTLGSHAYGSVGAVVGATYPEELGELRKKMPRTIFLIPGFGAQGGGAQDVMPGFDSRGLGAIVNSSRGIIFAYENPQFQANGDWQASVELACQKMTDELSLNRIQRQ